MDDLVRWLNAQLDADTARAQACPGNGEWSADDIAIYGPGLSSEVRTHMAEHDPARVLRGVEAKRQIVRDFQAALTERDNVEVGTDAYHRMVGAVTSLRRVVCGLAVEYSHRPGFKEEWRL